MVVKTLVKDVVFEETHDNTMNVEDDTATGGSSQQGGSSTGGSTTGGSTTGGGSTSGDNTGDPDPDGGSNSDE